MAALAEPNMLPFLLAEGALAEPLRKTAVAVLAVCEAAADHVALHALMRDIARSSVFLLARRLARGCGGCKISHRAERDIRLELLGRVHAVHIYGAFDINVRVRSWRTTTSHASLIGSANSGKKDEKH